MTFTRKQVFLALTTRITVVVLASLFFLITNSNSNSPVSGNSTNTSATSTTIASAAPVSTTSPSATVPPASALDNLGFEDSLFGWFAGEVTRNDAVPNKGWTVSIDHSVAYSGTSSVHIQQIISDPHQQPTYGIISTRLPANAFSGKRVRFSAYVRTSPVSGYTLATAGLWMHVIGTIDSTLLLRGRRNA